MHLSFWDRYNVTFMHKGTVRNSGALIYFGIGTTHPYNIKACRCTYPCGIGTTHTYDIVVYICPYPCGIGASHITIYKHVDALIYMG